MIINVNQKYWLDLYVDILKRYDRNVPLKNLGFKNTRKSKLKRFVELYESIKTNGYQEGPYDKTHIRGTVERNGHLIIRGGVHRLSILKHLKYDTIPILIEKTHDNFITFYDYIQSFQNLYSPIDYWICFDWKSRSGEDRANIILNHIEPESIILDLGCREGSLSHSFALEGHKVIGIDYNKEAIFCAEYIANHHDSRNELKEKYPYHLISFPKHDKYQKPIYLAKNIKKIITKIKSVEYTLFLSIYSSLKKDNIDNNIIKRVGKITKKAIFIDVEPCFEEELKQKMLKLTRFRNISKIGIETLKYNSFNNIPRTIYKLT